MKNKGIFNLNQILRKINSLISSGSIQRRLGYSKNAKLLIIHADDLGMSVSENTASIEAMGKGIVNSGSIMVPCPNFREIADYSKTHPEADLGIHLTLTSEWSSYKWKPVLPPNEVASIIDLNGSLLESQAQILKNAIPDEVGKEFRVQIFQAIEVGIDLTHIDTHMYTAFSNDEILKIYISLGKEFKLPVLLTYELPISTWFLKNAIVVDHLYCAKPEDYIQGLSNYYCEVMRSIKQGLNIILVHVAFNNKEMQYITGDQPNFGSAWRQADYDFFTSDQCIQLIQDNNIQLITWREIRDKLVR